MQRRGPPKFPPTCTVGEIVRFVADLRIKAEEDAELINTLLPEDIIRRAVDAPPMKDGGPDDIDRAGLERFIKDTTAYTQQWLAAQRTRSAGPGGQ